MNDSMCGATCRKCGFGQNNGCNGCKASGGHPFGKQCFVYNYIKTGGKENFEFFKKQLIDEFNLLNVEGMPKICELYCVVGSYVNLAYSMPNGQKIKLLDDRQIYLCSQVECEFNDGEFEKIFGVVAGVNFLLVAEYGGNCSDPELILYKHR